MTLLFFRDQPASYSGAELFCVFLKAPFLNLYVWKYPNGVQEI